MILPIVAEAGGGAPGTGGGARAHVAPAIVAGSIGWRLATGGRAGGACGVQARQLVGLAAVAVEILVGSRVIAIRADPQLPQMGIRVAVTEVRLRS